MFAIISDLHGNQEALESVMGHIHGQGITDVVCLGDIIGYGPNPEECIDIALTFKFALLGNHEEAVVREGFYGFNPLALNAMNWTRSKLKPNPLSTPQKKKRWEFISNLPATRIINDMFFVHGSPRNPTWEYVQRYDTEVFREDTPSKINEIFSIIKWLCFCGHTHDPGIITQECDFISPSDIVASFTFKLDRKYIVNVGSVGQPRDGDNRACYATVDGTKLRYHRVEYDYRKTQNKILATPELDKRLAARLG